MKSSRLSLLLSILCIMVVSCEREEAEPGAKKTIQFSFHIPSMSDEGSRTTSETEAHAVVVTVKDQSGTTVLERKELNLYKFNDAYLTLPVTLFKGDYAVTEFLIVNANKEIMYITPLSGSKYAHLVQRPLSILFTVNEDEITTITPEVVVVSDDAATYGYGQFGFEVVETTPFVVSCFIKNETNFELTDAFIQINGLIDGVSHWSYEQSLLAKPNVLSLRKFDSYELIVTKQGYKTWTSVVNIQEVPTLEIILEKAKGFPFETEWVKTLGGKYSDDGYDIFPTDDGGYLLTGTSMSSNGDSPSPHGGQGDFWVVKINTTGVVQWEKKYGSTWGETATAMDQTPDGGYVVAGYAFTDGWANYPDLQVMKISASGSVVWKKNFGTSQGESASAVHVFEDGTIMIGAYTYNVNYANDWIVKLDDQGNKMWDKTFSYGMITGMTYTHDGNFMLAGFTGHNYASDATIWAMKMDVDGNKQWKKDIGKGHPNKIIEMGNKYVIVGYTTISLPDQQIKGGEDGMVIQLDNEGNSVWQKLIGGTKRDQLITVAKTPAGGLLVGGFSLSADGDLSENKGNKDAWLTHLDENGVIIGSKIFGGTGYDHFQQLKTTGDGIIATGSSSSADGDIGMNKGSTDVLVVKLKPF